MDVRLIVPVRSNHISTDLARESYLRELHEAGGRVLLYQPAMLHAKAVIFDDQLAVIGSANMDNRSLFLNYEVAVFLYSREHGRRRLGLGKQLQGECLRELPSPGWARELAENVVRLLSPCSDHPGAGRQERARCQTRPSLPTPAACGWLQLRRTRTLSMGEDSLMPRPGPERRAGDSSSFSEAPGRLFQRPSSHRSTSLTSPWTSRQ